MINSDGAVLNEYNFTLSCTVIYYYYWLLLQLISSSFVFLSVFDAVVCAVSMIIISAQCWIIIIIIKMVQNWTLFRIEYNKNGEQAIKRNCDLATVQKFGRNSCMPKCTELRVTVCICWGQHPVTLRCACVCVCIWMSSSPCFRCQCAFKIASDSLFHFTFFLCSLTKCNSASSLPSSSLWLSILSILIPFIDTIIKLTTPQRFCYLIHARRLVPFQVGSSIFIFLAVSHFIILHEDAPEHHAIIYVVMDRLHSGIHERWSERMCE